MPRTPDTFTKDNVKDLENFFDLFVSDKGSFRTTPEAKEIRTKLAADLKDSETVLQKPYKDLTVKASKKAGYKKKKAPRSASSATASVTITTNRLQDHLDGIADSKNGDQTLASKFEGLKPATIEMMQKALKTALPKAKARLKKEKAKEVTASVKALKDLAKKSGVTVDELKKMI